MRRARMAVIVAPLLVALAPPAPPAAAHSCAVPVRAEVGQITALTIGVAAEIEPLVAVDVRVPDGFTLTGDVEVPSWQVAADGDTLHFTGGRIEPFGCGYVTVRGRATRKGRLVFPVTVTAEDGTTSHYTATDPALPNAAGLLYVGIDPPVPGADTDGGEDRGLTAPALVAVAAAVVLVLAGATAAWRRRLRTRPAPARAGRPPARQASGSSRPGKRKRPAARRR